MKGYRGSLAAALAAAGVAGALLAAAPAPARAQFGFTTSERFDVGRQREKAFYASVSLYPFATFLQGGYFPDADQAGTRSNPGRIIAAEAGWKRREWNTPIEAGGWLYSRGSSFNPIEADENAAGERIDLYELHARAYFTRSRELGVQVGYLGTSEQNGKGYTAFLISEYSTQRIRGYNRLPWGIQAGIGYLGDPSFNPYSTRTGQPTYTRGFSFFVQGSVQIGYRFTLNISEWYIRSRDQDLNRLALGLGYSL